MFDSGVGGLSVLRALRAAMPQASWRYVADSAWAPYGERSHRVVIERSMRIAEHLHGLGCDGLVVACNTATAIAIDAMRERWPQWSIIGVEPGVKPAGTATRNGRIGVMATPGTLASARYRVLVEGLPAHVTVIDRPCAELALLIERGAGAAAEREAAVQAHCTALRDEGVDTVVLGCTHYAFVHASIGQAMGPAVQIVDTAEAVARQTARRFAEWPALASAGGGAVRLATTAEPQPLRDIAAAWLPFAFELESISALA